LKFFVPTNRRINHRIKWRKEAEDDETGEKVARTKSGRGEMRGRKSDVSSRSHPVACPLGGDTVEQG
jgi:hypothetical protein